MNKLCKYGCGQVAIFKDRCDESHNKCPALKLKNSQAIKARIASGDIKYENRWRPECVWNRGMHFVKFENNCSFQEAHKNTLIDERGHQCEMCENTEWKCMEIVYSIPLQLEHINGNNRDNCKENLLLLCPNCHSQTETWRLIKPRGDIVIDDDTLYNTYINHNKDIVETLRVLKVGASFANRLIQICQLKLKTE